METTTGKREKWIDVLKGFAILCVVMGHTLDGVLGKGLYTSAEDVLIRAYDFIYVFHMPLFMLVSGYIFFKVYVREDGIRTEKLRRQIMNLLCLYFLFSLLYGLLKFGLSAFVSSDVGLSDILLIPIRPIGPYWYLYTMILFYLLFSFEAVRRINSCFLLILLFALSTVSKMFDIDGFFAINRVLFLAFFFLMGKIIVDYIEKCSVFAGVYFVVAIALFIVLYGNYESKIVYYIVKSIIAFGVSGGLALIAYRLEKWFAGRKCNLLEFLGEHSLEIYLLHVFFTTGFLTVFDKLHIGGLLGLLLIFILSVILPMVAAWILKKIKLYDLVFRPVSYIKTGKNK